VVATTRDDVRRIVATLPGVEESDDHFGFYVQGRSKHKQFVWTWNERVQPKKPRVPRPEVLSVRVADDAEKQALLASDPAKFFTEPHYDGFNSVLVRLPEVDVDELAELVVDAWRTEATPELIEQWDNRETR
jgi:hypothetical protein